MKQHRKYDIDTVIPKSWSNHLHQEKRFNNVAEFAALLLTWSHETFLTLQGQAERTMGPLTVMTHDIDDDATLKTKLRLFWVPISQNRQLV